MSALQVHPASQGIPEVISSISKGEVQSYVRAPIP
jgi:hypothetical protein